MINFGINFRILNASEIEVKVFLFDQFLAHEKLLILLIWRFWWRLIGLNEILPLESHVSHFALDATLPLPGSVEMELVPLSSVWDFERV